MASNVKFTVEGKGKNLKKTSKEANDLAKGTERAGKGMQNPVKTCSRRERIQRSTVLSGTKSQIKYLNDLISKKTPQKSVIKPGINKRIPANFVKIHSLGFAAIFWGFIPDLKK